MPPGRYIPTLQTKCLLIIVYHKTKKKSTLRTKIEEIFQDPKNPNDFRFHNLKHIEKEADNIGSLTHDESRGAESTSDVSTTVYSIADLYSFVKAYDKDFTPAPEIKHPELVLNEDGTHGAPTKKNPKGFFFILI